MPVVAATLELAGGSQRSRKPLVWKRRPFMFGCPRDLLKQQAGPDRPRGFDLGYVQLRLRTADPDWGLYLYYILEQ